MQLQHFVDTTPNHMSPMTAAKHVLRYLKGTANIGSVFLGSSASNTTDVLHGYINTDFAGNRVDWKSQLLAFSFEQMVN